MPYHSDRRLECNNVRAPATARFQTISGSARARREPPARRAQAVNHEGLPTTLEYQVRDARITDVERITALLDADGETPYQERPAMGQADLLRQLVYLPQAVVLVAEFRRQLVGAAVVALRPSVRQGGFVGTIDALVVDADYERPGVIDALLTELMRSCRNKGCVVVEAEAARRPEDESGWNRHGFAPGRQRLERSVAVATSSAPR